MPYINKIITSIFMTLLISGCTSFGEGVGRGITQAMLEKSKTNDTRVCKIWSNGFTGIGQNLNKPGKTKVLIVHGVGNTYPGYSTLIMENLADKLGLDTFTNTQKNMTITDLYNNKKDLGNLRLTRLTSKDNKKELLFYELTWSNISRPEKEVLSFYQTDNSTFKKTDINQILKKATNDAMADPLVYLGQKQRDIQISVAQSYCWMIATTYDDFPDGAYTACKLNDKRILERAKKDNYTFISHSLGSRITIDALQRIAGLLNKQEWKSKYPELQELHEVMRKRDINIFMLANQLQLLQLGRPLPAVAGQINNYCHQNSPYYKERFANKTHIIAFNDPNDVLSHSISQQYKEKYLDSRMCPEITNININIANIMNVFGVELANPIDAHTSYNKDERIMSLLAYGIDNQHTSQLIKDKCTWVKTIN